MFAGFGICLGLHEWLLGRFRLQDKVLIKARQTQVQSLAPPSSFFSATGQFPWHTIIIPQLEPGRVQGILVFISQNSALLPIHSQIA